MFNITIKQCRYFVAVAKYGGMAQAARNIYISQPAIAQAMDKLEANCGYKIFIRNHAKGFDLTPKGRATLIEVENILAQTDNAARAINAIKNNEQGKIRLGCFSSIAPFYLAKIVKQFNQKYPQITIEFFELLHGDMVGKLQDDKLDLALMYDMALEQHNVAYEPLLALKPYIILPKNHEFAGRKKIKISNLINEPYVLFDAAGSREYFYKMFSNVGFVPNISFKSTSIEVVKSAVANGLGYSILTMRPPNKQSYDGGEIVELEITDALEPLEIVIASKRGFDVGSIYQQFIDFCKLEVFN